MMKNQRYCGLLCSGSHTNLIGGNNHSDRCIDNATSDLASGFADIITTFRKQSREEERMNPSRRTQGLRQNFLSLAATTSSR